MTDPVATGPMPLDDACRLPVVLLALALVTLVLMSTTGCSVRAPDVEPAVVLADPEPGQGEGSPEPSGEASESAVKDDAQNKAGEAAHAGPHSFTEWRGQLSGPARLDGPASLGQVLAVFYRMRSRAFMAPVASHVQGAVNLGGVGGERETRRCPDGGVFHLEWHSGGGKRSRARELVYRFDSCRGAFGDGPLLSLNGHYRRDFQALADSEQVIESFDVHGFMGETGSQQRIALRGKQRIERPAQGGVVRKTERMEMLKGETYTALVNSRDQIRPEEGSGDSDFASFDTRFITTLEGRLLSSELGGWVDIATGKNLVEQQAPCSASGVVNLTAARNGEVRFGPDTGTHHRVALELESGEVTRYERCSGFGEAFGFGR